MPTNEPILLAALTAVPDPTGGGDIVAGGRITTARLVDGVATIIADAGGLGDRDRQDMEERIRTAAAAIPEVKEVRIAVTADKRSRRIIAVGSGKGGVGKSTVAANLAIALSRQGLKIGLVDADIYGPSQPRIMGKGDKPEAKDKTIIPVEAHGVRMLSIGQLVDANTALAWRGPMATSALGQLIEGDWQDTELLIVDLPPGTGDVQLSLMQKWKPSGAVLVSTPQDLALIDARRAVDLFRKTHVPILGLIENMAGYACPHCGAVSDPFGIGGAEAAAAEMGIEFLGRIPLRTSIRLASDAGRPPAAGTGEEADLFAALAEALLARMNPQPA